MKSFLIKKRVLLTAFLTVSTTLFAQQAKVLPHQQEVITNITDTLIEKDPRNLDMEYWIMRNVRGNLMAQGAYFQGRKHGVWREYMGGNSIMTQLAQYDMGRRNGPFLTFSMLGQVNTDETFRNDTLQGQRTVYQSNGRVKYIEFYKNGLLNGPKKAFYDNNNIQEETNYKNGLRDGLTKWYLINGNVSLEMNYRNGELEGASHEYFEDGSLKKEGEYKNNEQEGEWKEYEQGKIVKRTLYKEGKLIKELSVKK